MVKVAQDVKIPTADNTSVWRFFFTALHWMQGGLVTRKLSVRLSICLSVCLSVWHTRALWQNEKQICPDFIRYEGAFSL